MVKMRLEKRLEYPGNPAINKWFMEVYGEAVKEVKDNINKPRVLILGATPETRDLVLDNQMNLAILDQNKEIINKMTLLMKNKNSGLEKAVTGSWLKMPFTDNSFDLVLGDGVSNNIEYDKQNDFFNEIKRVLKKGGIMLLREGALKKDFPVFTIRELLESYRKDKDFANLFLKLNIFSEVSYRDKDRHYFDMAQMFEQLKNYKNIFAKEEFEKIMTWRGDLKHTIININELKVIIGNVFKKIEIINNEDGLMLSFWPFFKAQKIYEKT